MKKKVIFMGTPEFAVPILKTLIKIKDIEVVMVISRTDAYVGRKKELKMTPVKEEALKNKIEVNTPIKIGDIYTNIKNKEPDLIVTCAYGQIVPKSILDIPKLGCINVHASLLPKYRGGAPIHRAIMNGDAITGVTIMYMDEGMDSGDIIKEAKIDILPEDNVETMHAKLSKLGAQTLEEVLPSILDGTNERVKQNVEEVTFAKIIKREDEHLDFQKKALDIHNQVRGLNSWPLANTLINKEEFKVLEGFIGEDKPQDKEAGVICKITKEAIGITCLDKIYYITKIKPFGKKVMLVKDYLNGVNKDKLMGAKVE